MRNDANDIGLFPPGHFNSPIPRREEAVAVAVEEKKRRITPGIDFRLNEQLDCARGRTMLEEPFAEMLRVGRRFELPNDFFSYGDSFSLFATMLERKPSSVVEVGSGYSSALMLDAAEFLCLDTRFTFVEPYPERLHAFLGRTDPSRVQVITDRVQDQHPEMFQELGTDDLLFIDSSHVVKTGSDVLFLLCEVLPRLSTGVVVHLHDIFYPFEYPFSWLAEGRFWNEAYFLRAILQDSPRYRIVWFNDQLRWEAGEEMRQLLPTWAKNPGGSIYLEVA